MDYDILALILFGILTARVLSINKDFRSDSRGYILKAVFKIWYVFLLTTIVNIAFSYLYYNFVLLINLTGKSNYLSFGAILSGYVSVASPEAFLKFKNLFTQKNNTNCSTIAPQIELDNLHQFKEEYNLNINKQLQREIEMLKHKDRILYERQNNWWDLKLDTNRSKSIEMSHNRLRFLYEHEKRGIWDYIKVKNVPVTDLESDLHIIFRLLVEYFGRKELKIELLKEPAETHPNATWFGEARRKNIGKNRFNMEIGNRLSDIYDIS